MFYFLSKTIDFLLMPMNISLILLMWGMFVKNRRKRNTALILSLMILLMTSNSYIVNKAFTVWEYKQLNIKDVADGYDVGVVLTGGMINWATFATDHIGFGGHADRFLQAYLLYKNGKIKKIMISGASPGWLTRQGKGEGLEVKRLLIQWGVKPGDIVLEQRARNTRENAVFSEKLLAEQFPGQKYLLITSSFHMKRSMACFEKTGLKMDAFPADFYGGDFRFKVKDLLIPDPEVIGYFNLLWREWIGFVIYRIMGYC
ncbi:hypothetical protein DYBT9275_00559 [Dyadobacter sp. CECT 9275]|uniref:DUF218 domain-containing protein n=1 Tax=Dyadobacter helix TaxID=2822344 RepID=A0A916N2L7_9BACT|nr:YdcF family protein [Dyadobacter sp. CECT 9275]CAG4990569.1 hypothetical protein DYBT9275_00559 [Dyadobacter sp. CECT 9275]